MKLKVFDIAALAVSVTVFAVFFIFGLRTGAESGYVLIQEQSGESVYPLDEDRVITVEGPIGESVIVIEDGAARFEHSDCSDNLCVLMGAVDEGGEWAACLPNKVFITIEGGTEADETDTLSY